MAARDEATRRVSEGQGGSPGEGDSPGQQEGGQGGLGSMDEGALRALIDERVQPLVEAAREEGRREMQSIKDREIAQLGQRQRAQFEALDGLYQTALSELGASPEDVTKLRQTFDEQQQERQREARLRAYEQYYQQQEAYEATQQRIDETLAAAGLTRETDGLVLDGTEQEFLASVAKALRETAGGQGTEGGQPSGDGDAPDKPQPEKQPKHVESGGAAALGAGGTERSTHPNPIADIDDPYELLKMGLKGE